MALVKAGSASALEPGRIMEVRLGKRRIAVCNVDGALHAVDGICPHNGGPLAHGALHGSVIVCPWHAWEFDCVTGEYDLNSDVRLRTYPVVVSGGDILVDVS
jgi:nitrite reductase/ring-hydroxylating ferredoxin subunit